MASLAEYDLHLPDEPQTNQLMDSLRLFKYICSIKWFAHATLLLFLNKKDIFARKIKNNVHLNVCFPEYEGPPRSYENAVMYICQRFEEQCVSKRQIYRHFTCAKDRGNISRVFQLVKDELMNITLSGLGIY